MTKISPTTEDIERFIAANPDRNGGSWAGWGGSLVYRVLTSALAGIMEPRAYPSVAIALRKTKILSLDAAAAPVGAIHWWRSGASQGEDAYNAGVDTDGGGLNVLLVSPYPIREGVTEVGVGLIITAAERYTVLYGGLGNYAGWSLTYGEPLFPEHDKLRDIAPQTQAVGDFLEWVLQERGYFLAEKVEGQIVPISSITTGLLAEFAQIDQEVIDVEKEAMLELQFAVNAAISASIDDVETAVL